MTDTPVMPAASQGGARGARGAPARGPETFWDVVYRRTRYACAIAISAGLFATVGWMAAAPPASMEGVTLLAWGNHGLLTSLMLAGILLVATAVCSLVVHPDAPHTGLFCAMLGLGGLAIRGGDIHMLVQEGQIERNYAALGPALAAECVQWGAIFLLAEVFARLLHERFLANMRWIMRSGPNLALEVLQKTAPGSGGMGISMQVSRALRTSALRRRVATPLAMVLCGAIAWVLLYVLLRSQLKGQVLMACFAAFCLASLCAYLTFPRVPALALLLSVPLTAAVGYFYGRNVLPEYPGQAGFFMMRALPIDYIAAGIPGAIMGYYAAFRWSLDSHEEG